MVLAKHPERGSAIIMLFVAVSLFGAIGWVLLQSSRTSTDMIKHEAAKGDPIAQADCLNTVNLAVKRLTARSCDAISYRLDGASTDTPDGTCSIYTGNGGGVKPCRLTTSEWCIQNMYGLAVGESCGGLFYIGTFAGHRTYASATDAGKTTWNKGGTSGSLLTAATSTADGKANTDTLVGLSNGYSPYKAAALCRALGPDWYLPSVNELKAIVNLPSIFPTLATGGGTWDKAYWSSTDKDLARSCGMMVKDSGTCGAWSRGLALNVRCVRR